MGFRGDHRGSTILEFAILGIPLTIMVFAFFELLLMAASSVVLDNAAEEASRQVYTGEFQKSANNTDYDLKQLICNQAVLLRCNDDLLVDVRDFDDWANVSLPKLIASNGSYTESATPSTTNKVTIAGDRIVVMRIVYRWRLYTPGLTYFLRGAFLGNKYLFQARVFIVEPWDFLGGSGP